MLILAGATMCAISIGGRVLIKRIKLNSLKQSSNSLELVQRYKHAFEDPMSRREAALILGISIRATEAEINQAYKQLIVLNHPDRGGSSFMAMKINHAKDLMLVK